MAMIPKFPRLEPRRPIVLCYIKDRHWEGHYPSAEMQLVYSSAPAKKKKQIPRMHFFLSLFTLQVEWGGGRVVHFANWLGNCSHATSPYEKPTKIWAILSISSRYLVILRHICSCNQPLYRDPSSMAKPAIIAIGVYSPTSHLIYSCNIWRPYLLKKPFVWTS